MDCGPAALKSLLASFGVEVSYGRLREACQTDVDGTSIDTLEEVANQLGLVAEQVMLPVDHLLIPEAKALPCIIVVRLPNGVTHFVVVWRRHGDLVQIMDPGVGRRWVTVQRLLDDLYVHEMPVPASAWREWADTEEFLAPLRGRLRELGVSTRRIRGLEANASSDADWHGLAALDAATRMVATLVRAGGVRAGRQAGKLIATLYERARAAGAGEGSAVPPSFWQVRPVPDDVESDEPLVILRGCVLVRALGKRGAHGVVEPEDEELSAEPLSPELVAALEEPPARPGRMLWRLLREDGMLTPFVLLIALLLAAGGVLAEALIFRGFFEVGRDLAIFEQRLGYLGTILVVIAALVVLEVPIRAGLLRLGRHLEIRLRLAFLEKIPKLGDRYFQSRLNSDMTERSHVLHVVRMLPSLAGHALQAVFGLALTTIGIAWLDPASTPWAILAAAGAVILPILLQPPLTGRDMRLRTHTGGLTRFYLDAFLGLVPARTHGAERALRRDHEGLLVDWTHAGLSMQRAVVVVEGLLWLSGFAFAALLLFNHLGRGGQGGAVLLLVYWALNLPVLGQQIGLVARQYPTLRNITLRLLEPLGAPEQLSVTSDELDTSDDKRADQASGVDIRLEGVTVRAAGHTILSDVDMTVNAGEHVAIVGPSGAGKSSLVGVFLGWHRAAAGNVIVDGQELDGAQLERLRRQTAWVDPAVQLWNRPLYDNLLYGASDGPSQSMAHVIEEADLRKLLEALPDGMQTSLGESGGLVSGGEGQRVRLGRALARRDVRLVILDEPFRGLDRERRRKLLARARAWWQDATLLYITHDVGQTEDFERVLVIEQGQLVEDSAPGTLLERASRYRTLIESEETVRTGLWHGAHWRRLWLEHGRIEERPGDSGDATVTHPDDSSANGPSNTIPSSVDQQPAAPSAGSRPDPLEPLMWPGRQLGHAIESLARESRLPYEHVELPAAPDGLSIPETPGLDAWIEGAARRMGLEAESVEAAYVDAEALARGAGPALVVLRRGAERRLLVLLGRRGDRIRLLGPNLREHSLPVEQLRLALCQVADDFFGADVDALLEEAGVAKSRRDGVRSAILREQLGPMRLGGCWIFRLPPEANFWSQLRRAGMVRNLGLLAGSHAIQYVLFLVSWWLIGRGALGGTLEVGWLIGWALLLVSLVPFRMLATWCQGRFSIGAGALMKRRLLQGALRLEPEEIRHEGAGQLLARVLESEALEYMAISGGFLVVTASIELVAATIILAIGAGGALHVIALLVWIGLAVFLSRRYVRQRWRWTDTRLEMTNELVERMVGHRTRLAQQAPERWHEGEDQTVDTYLHASTGMDRTYVTNSALVSRGWVLLGLAVLAIPFLSGDATIASLAIAIGGIIAAQQALAKVSMSIADIGGAAIAWDKVAPLFKSAARDAGGPTLEAVAREAPVLGPGEPLVEADEIVFGYPGRPEPVINHCSLHIEQGDRLLLEGPSGGGKSTLAALLIGLRQPQSGLLLMRGLDRQTLGIDGWRSHVTAAPQFHENHVFTETFAFNLLMGRGWPAHPSDMEEAEALCYELGLGPLLQQMPAGMLQMVGETGWQLSHGERSRLFLARALLEKADLIVLDESFAALDPENLEKSLRCVLDRAPTLLVIAHP